MSVPRILANGVGNWPDADKFMDNYDYVEALAKGNYMSNPGFELWNNGTTFTNPTSGTLVSNSWTWYKTGTTAPTADVAREGTTKDTGAYATKIDITGSGSGDSTGELRQSNANYIRFAGLSVAFGARIKTSASSKLRVKIYDGTTTAYSQYHTGDGTWQNINVTANLSLSLSQLTVSILVSPADFTGQIHIDGAFLYVVSPSISEMAKNSLSLNPAGREIFDYVSFGALGVGGYMGLASGDVSLSTANYFIASDGTGVNINAPNVSTGEISFSRGNTGVAKFDINNYFFVGEQLGYGLLAGSTGLIQARAQGFDAKMRLQTVRSGGGNWLAFDRANGTFSSMTALLSGDAFGSVVGVGHYGNSSSFAHGPEIRLIASQNWSAGNYGCGIEFYTIQNGATTQYRNLNITEDGSIILNHAALATNAQGGFLYIASCAGVATGTPATNTGRVPMVYDTTNNKLGIYNGAWKWVTLA